MRVLLAHPSALMSAEIFLRLEPLGLERVAAALLADGHDVRLTDLQVYRRSELECQVRSLQPTVRTPMVTLCHDPRMGVMTQLAAECRLPA